MKNIEPYILALNAHPKIGSQTIAKICHAFNNDLKKAWEVSEAEISKRLEQQMLELLVECRTEYAPEKELEKLSQYGVGFITYWDKDYPKALKEIPSAPAILYVKGDFSVLKEKSIAIVGSRKFTSYGAKAAAKISKEVSETGMVIVSGLALGIDSIVQRANVEAKGKTIAVLACGLDQVYPTSNKQLAEQIINLGGAVVSEYPIGTPPYKQNFPLRNRIIAGLSLGTLVVEAQAESGALITAFLALDYNREVFAVPGNIDSENSEGSNYLIQKGAKLVMKTEDIFDELNINIQTRRREEFMPESEDEKVIYEIIKTVEGPVIDEIVKSSGLNIVSVNTNLTILEMKGIVSNVGGRIFLK